MTTSDKQKDDDRDLFGFGRYTNYLKNRKLMTFILFELGVPPSQSAGLRKLYEESLCPFDPKDGTH